MTTRALIALAIALSTNFAHALDWDEPLVNPPAINVSEPTHRDIFLVRSGEFSFYENSTDSNNLTESEDYSPVRFVLKIEESGDWAYDLTLGYMSEYLVSSGLLAANSNEGIYSLGLGASIGDWSFGTWTGQSADDPGRDGTYANEFDLWANWSHVWGDHFVLSVGVAYFDLAAPRLFSGTGGDLVELEVELAWPFEHLTSYVILDNYFEIAGNDGDGFVVRAGIRGHWGGEECWWDIDVSLGHAEEFFGTRDYIITEAAMGFQIGENTSVSIPKVQLLIVDGEEDHLAVGVSVAYKFN